ncbi:MAG TPA: sulfotransferase [Nevskiaceae bacterium]|nr:sulfotransferase [Nevskiaceae bacterium]
MAAERPLPAALEAALQARDWAGLIARCTAWLQATPADHEVRFLRGVARLEQRQPVAALEDLRPVAQAAPAVAAHWAQLARAAALAQQMGEATAAAHRVLALAEASAQDLDTAGVVLSRAQDHAGAVRAFQAATTRGSDQAARFFNLASALKFCGRLEEAAQAYERCLQLDPRHWKVYPLLVALRSEDRGVSASAALRERLAALDAGDPEAHLHLQMALARRHEQRGDHRAAFAAVQAAKSALRRVQPYDPGADQALLTAALNWRPQPGRSGETLAPVFIVGLPRSGTTLLERMLSRHPALGAGAERMHFPMTLHRLGQLGGDRLVSAALIERAGRLDPQAVGSAYRAACLAETGGAERFIDKLPLNTWLAGPILEALPQARVIALRRHPLDSCLGQFRQIFGLRFSDYRYSSDLLDCGRYWLAHERLLAHWQAVLPAGRFVCLDYEALVEDAPTQLRRLLAFCDLDWQPDCLAFADNPAPVASASAVQVRGALNREGIGRWRAYRPDLDGLIGLLRQAGVETPEAG